LPFFLEQLPPPKIREPQTHGWHIAGFDFRPIRVSGVGDESAHTAQANNHPHRSLAD
jgi:hypothetical protein